jgi:biopolymer transport protein ExbB/TolQ
MNTYDYFQGSLFREGRQWIAKCLLFVLIIVTGWLVDYLQTACVVAIGLFIVAQGILPFLAIAKDLQADRRQCREEKRVLQQSAASEAGRLLEIDVTEAGSIFKLLAAIKRAAGRVAQEEAAERFLAAMEQQWQERLRPLDDAAEQAPVLGFGGSLLGILSGLGSMQTLGDAGFSAGVATMASTSLIGCVGALVQAGLASSAQAAVTRHLAELRVIAALLLGSDNENRQQRDDDGFQSIF